MQSKALLIIWIGFCACVGCWLVAMWRVDGQQEKAKSSGAKFWHVSCGQNRPGFFTFTKHITFFVPSWNKYNNILYRHRDQDGSSQSSVCTDKTCHVLTGFMFRQIESETSIHFVNRVLGHFFSAPCSVVNYTCFRYSLVEFPIHLHIGLLKKEKSNCR